MKPQDSFPDFDNWDPFYRILDRLEPFGFTDTTWKNDLCPSISLLNKEGDDIEVRLWIDYKDPEMRESPDMSELWIDFGGFGQWADSVDDITDHAMRALSICGTERLGDIWESWVDSRPWSLGAETIQDVLYREGIPPRDAAYAAAFSVIYGFAERIETERLNRSDPPC